MGHTNPSGTAESGHGDPEVIPAAPLLNPQNLAVLAFILALISVAIFAVFSRRRSKSRGNALLLVGPPDAGKTAILSKLVYGQALQTHTSLQPNSSVIALPSAKKNIRIVDIPGHPRIRDQFREYLDDAKVIAFVVDASSVSRNGAVVAEHLHNVLHTIISLPPSQTLPTLIILAHKSDLLNTNSTAGAGDSLAINRVRTVLERELEKRRVSQSGGVGVEGLGAEGEKSEMGGLDCNSPAGSAFKFADWEGGEVAFIGTSVKIGKVPEDAEKVGDDGLASLREWLDDNM
ncbi:Signal recognition particle receptor subunit beta [Hypsizygus marmoreus]|uniref:Signal recognition particle receptor subunit beta n=1 Tax=Hypsizygus marmoreus TaxID=39966 RepID=A0A369JIW2_HYPMA|nr:Signal recognition particle receptor subunit beta [Hypsizygus marmoreus]